jgi:hypothetical protein
MARLEPPCIPLASSSACITLPPSIDESFSLLQCACGRGRLAAVLPVAKSSHGSELCVRCAWYDTHVPRLGLCHLHGRHAGMERFCCSLGAESHIVADRRCHAFRRQSGSHGGFFLVSGLCDLRRCWPHIVSIKTIRGGAAEVPLADPEPRQVRCGPGLRDSARPLATHPARRTFALERQNGWLSREASPPPWLLLFSRASEYPLGLSWPCLIVLLLFSNCSPPSHALPVLPLASSP